MGIVRRMKTWLKQLAVEKRKGAMPEDASVIPGKKAPKDETHDSGGRNNWRRRAWLPVFMGGKAYLKDGAIYMVQPDGWRRVRSASKALKAGAQ